MTSDPGSRKMLCTGDEKVRVLEGGTGVVSNLGS